MADFKVGDEVKVVDLHKRNQYGDAGVIEQVINNELSGTQYIVRITKGRYESLLFLKIAMDASEIELRTKEKEKSMQSSSPPKDERVLTDSPIRHIWLQFGILSTYSGAKDFLRRKYAEASVPINDEYLEQKAQGLAFCIRNANEYFTGSLGHSVISSCLAYYYGTLSLLSALLLSRTDNMVTLEILESYTRQGHGLGLFYDDEIDFPESVNVFVLNGGFLHQYLRNMAVDVSTLCVGKRYNSPKEVQASDRAKIFSARDLLSRIPEIRNLYIEIFREQPNYLSFDIYDDSKTNTVDIKFPFYRNSVYLTIDKVRELVDWPETIPLDFDDVHGEFSIKTAQQLPTVAIKKLREQVYKSVMSFDCYIKPLLSINDPLILNFMLLYCISIWVRYSPALWRDISEGARDIYRPLFVNYLNSVERVLPNLVLDRIYGKKFLFAGHSYLS